jgi:hypothetical protein
VVVVIQETEMNVANSILLASLLTLAASAAEIAKEIPLWDKGAPGSEGETSRHRGIRPEASSRA